MPDNGAIAEAFQLLGDLLQLEGADRHQVNSRLIRQSPNLLWVPGRVETR